MNVDLVRENPSFLAKALGRLSPSIRNSQNNHYGYKIKVGKNTVGTLQLDKLSAKELNVNWISVNKKAKGKKIAQAVMNDVIKNGRELGVSKITLEVPGASPDARHIYNKVGFKANKQISSSDDAWGGLTSMTYRYKKKK